jgi:hypothetical protein
MVLQAVISAPFFPVPGQEEVESPEKPIAPVGNSTGQPQKPLSLSGDATADEQQVRLSSCLSIRSDRSFVAAAKPCLLCRKSRFSQL